MSSEEIQQTIEPIVEIDAVKSSFPETTYEQDLEKYTKLLHDLNKSDLQSHAIKVGLIPVDNRDILTKRLLKEFAKYASGFKTPKVNKTEINRKSVTIG